LQNRANSVPFYTSKDLGHTGHTEDFNSKRKKNNSLTLKKHADLSFNNLSVQELVYLKWNLSNIPWKVIPSTKALPLDDSTSCHAVADVTT